MAKRLSNDEFLTNLTTLLTSTHTATHGSVHLTQKPLSTTTTISSPDSSTSESASQSQILIRATNGLSKSHRTDKALSKSKPKIRLSTVVDVNDLEGFYARYAEVCKKGMEGLRKRDKKKAKDKKKKAKGKGGAATG